ncbi:MAG TPA: hypothetical protein VGL33_23100 [Streptosporangiaceae bacterium]
MGRPLPSRTITRTAGAGPARCHRAVTLPAGRDQEAQAQAVPVRAVPVQAVPVRAVPVRAVPVALPRLARAGRARVRRTGRRRRTVGRVHPGPL